MRRIVLILVFMFGGPSCRGVSDQERPCEGDSCAQDENCEASETVEAIVFQMKTVVTPTLRAYV